MRDEKMDLDVKFQALLNRISGMKENYQTVTKEVLKNVDKPNQQLQAQINKLTNLANEKENEMEYIVVRLAELVQTGPAQSS